MAARITTWSGMLGVGATCDDCGWEAESRNALGIAKQHADRYGHTVRVEQTIGVTYTPEGSPYDQAQQARKKEG